MKVGIYSDGSTVPNALLYEEEFTGLAVVNDWAGTFHEFTLTTPFAITDATVYWIAFVPSTGSGYQVYYNPTGGVGVRGDYGTYTLSDPFETPFDSNTTDVCAFCNTRYED
jgi:hypothetical protein